MKDGWHKMYDYMVLVENGFVKSVYVDPDTAKERVGHIYKYDRSMMCWVNDDYQIKPETLRNGLRNGNYKIN